METKQVVYVLELYGDISCTGGSIIVEVGGVSTNKGTLEKLMKKKEKELDKYFSDRDEDESDPCYQNTDYTDRPSWTITEYEMLK